MNAELSTKSPIYNKWIYGVVVFISAGTFISQIILSHILGLIFQYDFRFLSASIALFGLGAGGIAALLFLNRNEHAFQKNIILVSGLYAATTVLPFLFIRIRASYDAINVFVCIILFLLSFLNFFLAGLTKALIYTKEKNLIYKLYCSDLFGMALAGVVTLFIADIFGLYSTVNLIFIVGLCGFFCCTKYYSEIISVKYKMAVAVLLSSIATISINTSFVIEYPSDLKSKIREGSNSFSQVSMFTVKENLDYSKFMIVINRTIKSRGYIFKNIESLRDELNEFNDARNILFGIRSYEKALIVGAGGGVDIIRALLSGSKEITAIEINPLIVEFMNSFPKSVGESPYQDPKVTTIIGEARSYILKSKKKQDLILVAHVKNFGRPLGTQLFIPKHLYTTEAFSTYIDKLNHNGMLVVVDYLDFTNQYLKTIAKLTQKKGLDLKKSLLSLTDLSLGVEFLVFNISGFSEEERENIRTAAKNQNFVYCDDFTKQIESQDTKVLTDDHPFLWQSDQGGKTRSPLYTIPAKKILEHFMILAILAVGSVLAASLLFLLRSKSKLEDSFILTFFIGISLGLASLQFVLVNKVTLLLGNPVYSHGIFLFLLLLFGGVGSLTATNKMINRNLGKISLVVAMLMILYYFLLDRAIATLLSAPYLLKIIAIVFIIFIPGFFSGMLFPIAFEKIGNKNIRLLPWAWAIDTLAFVAASLVLSFMVLFYGIKMILILGGLGYAVAAVVSKRLE